VKFMGTTYMQMNSLMELKAAFTGLWDAEQHC
jgi:hypothetical protein